MAIFLANTFNINKTDFKNTQYVKRELLASVKKWYEILAYTAEGATEWEKAVGMTISFFLLDSMHLYRKFLAPLRSAVPRKERKVTGKGNYAESS